MAVDPGTAAIVASSLLLAKEPLNKLLGPTLDYFGKEIESFAQKRAENIGRILRKAIKILGPKIDEPGQVHPKLLKGLILEGSFCDDELTAEYYGGVLASSRTGVNRDNRGAIHLDQISRLSTYQIRTHFIIYSVIRQLFQSVEIFTEGELDIGHCARVYSIFIPQSDYNIAMDFDDKEDVSLCTQHSLTGLDNNGLVKIISYSTGKSFPFQSSSEGLTVPERGFLTQPTIAGAEFFLWATGHGDVDVNSILIPDIEIPKDIKIPTKAVLTPNLAPPV